MVNNPLNKLIRPYFLGGLALGGWTPMIRIILTDTFDGRNPAPVEKKHYNCTYTVNSGIFSISTGAGFLPSTVSYFSSSTHHFFSPKEPNKVCQVCTVES